MAVDSIMVLLLVAVTFDILLANHHSYIYKYVDTVVLLTLKRHTRTSMALNIYFFLRLHISTVRFVNFWGPSFKCSMFTAVDCKLAGRNDRDRDRHPSSAEKKCAMICTGKKKKARGHCGGHCTVYTSQLLCAPCCAQLYHHQISIIR